MEGLVVGLLVGVAIGSAGAIAGVRDLVVRPGTSATVLPGRQYSTAVTFAGIDLECSYSYLLAKIGLEPKGSPVLFCARKSVPGSNDPNAVQSRMVIVSKYRYTVTNNRGEWVYTVNRAP
jgi:hypothetical protein